MASFRDAIRNKDFVITVEPPLHALLTRDSLCHSFAALEGRVDGVQVGDDDEAEPHIAPLAVASIALSLGVDPVIHLSARDRNRIAVHGEILGAAALGVTSLVLKRGNKLPAALKGRVKSVFDSRTAQLLQLAARVSETAPVVTPPGLLLGAMVTAISPEPGWQAARVAEKIDSGAGFLQSRPCLDLELLKRYAAALVALKLTHCATFIANVPLLTSAQDLRWLNEILPDTVIPRDLPKQLLDAANPRDRGIADCVAAIASLRGIPGVSGVNLIYRGDVADVLEVLERAGS